MSANEKPESFNPQDPFDIPPTASFRSSKNFFRAAPTLSNQLSRSSSNAPSPLYYDEASLPQFSSCLVDSESKKKKSIKKEKQEISREYIQTQTFESERKRSIKLEIKHEIKHEMEEVNAETFKKMEYQQRQQTQAHFSLKQQQQQQPMQPKVKLEQVKLEPFYLQKNPVMGIPSSPSQKPMYNSMLKPPIKSASSLTSNRSSSVSSVLSLLQTNKTPIEKDHKGSPPKLDNTNVDILAQSMSLMKINSEVKLKESKVSIIPTFGLAKQTRNGNFIFYLIYYLFFPLFPIFFTDHHNILI